MPARESPDLRSQGASLSTLRPLRVLALILGAGLPHCDGDSPASAGDAAPSARVAGFPRSVVGADGKSITLAAPPRRIVPASARAIDLVAALADAPRVAALPEQAFEYTTPGVARDEFRKLPRFDVYGAEPILQLLPDLVVADPWQSVDTRARLSDAGVPVLIVPDVVEFADVAPALTLVARALGAEDRARDVLADFDARVARLAAGRASRDAAGAAPMRALCYANFGAEGFSAGSRTTLDSILRAAGLVNVVAESGEVGHVNLTFERLLALDPDVIVVSEPLNAPTGIAGDRGGASERVLVTEPSLARLRAVRERRIIALPAGLYATASQGLVSAAERLAAEVDALRARLASGESGDDRR